MAVIKSFSGKDIDIENISPDDIDILDIAHSLSLLCRGCGHTRYFYSVAQHSIECAKEAMARYKDTDLAFLCLIHDASECYLNDLPTPIKAVFPKYVKLENKIMKCVYKKLYGRIPSEEQLKTVLQIDEEMKLYDLYYLVGKGDLNDLPVLSHKIDYEEKDWIDTEQDFISLYSMYIPDSMLR